MKKAGGAVAAIASVALLAGCGTAPVRDGAARVDNIDRAKVAAVEEAARASGARVVWVRPPEKREQP